MKIIAENHLGQKLTLNNNFNVVNVDGLTPSRATINTFEAGIADGAFFNSSRLNSRYIVLTIVPEGNPEEARLTLYRYFIPKYKIRLYFQTGHRNVYIDGYTEAFDGPLYSKKQVFQITIMCPQPFFNDIKPITVTQSKVVNNITFPFSLPEKGITLSNVETLGNVNVLNSGEESTGVIIQLLATDHVVEPTIYNLTTRQMFTFEYELLKGDVVTIDTRRGKKTIVLEREGVKSNLINSIAKGSNWFTLPIGDNSFTFNCIYGLENLKVSYIVHPLYGGL